MCGIFGYVGSRTDAAAVVFEGLKALEYRGYDSWGVAAVASGKIIVKKKIGKIGDATVSDMPESSFALGHTRWATHGGVSQENAHPHLDCSGTIALVHNGIFENYEEYKKKLLARGHQFTSQTDTEVTVHLIEEYGKHMSFSKAVQKAFCNMQGLDAIIAMNPGTGEFAAVRNGSPLVVGYGKGENFIASDAFSLLPYTRNVHYLEDDQMAVVTAEDVRLFHVRTGAIIRPRIQHVDWTVEQTLKGNYPNFMLKEIHEQPGLIADIAATAAGPAEKLAGIIRRSYGTYLVGCGTASYAALAGSYLFSKIAKRHVNCAVGSEFGYHVDFLTKKSLVLAISQSGETIDILESVKKAKDRGARVSALVNVLGSSLYRTAHEKMMIGVGPEKSVASTKAFTGMLSHLILAAYALDNRVREGQKMVTKAAEITKRLLNGSNAKNIERMAGRLKASEHMYVIGRGLSFPASLETALKIKEISYIHAEGLAAGELKHGPLALVTKGTPVIAFLPNDETYGANLAGAMEMKARGAYVIGVSYKPHEVFDEYIAVEDAKEATIISNVVVGQLLAYYLTIEKGLDPDKPRNLAKSVTVR